LKKKTGPYGAVENVRVWRDGVVEAKKKGKKVVNT